MKLIDYRLYDPTNALFSNKNSRAEYRELMCNGYENCQAYKQGCCVVWNYPYKKCPYGTKKTEIGFTRRARKFRSWISERRERSKDIKQLHEMKKLALIGDYIYFDYPYWYMDRKVKFPENYTRGGAFINGEVFFKKEDFTVEFFQSIVEAVPCALMGGEILDYRKEIRPKIVQHMREQWPEFYEKWKSQYPETAKRYDKADYVGRHAYIHTVVPNSLFKIRYDEWLWTGEQFKCYDSTRTLSSPVKGKIEIIVTPLPDTTIEIQNNDQVNENTKFKD